MTTTLALSEKRYTVDEWLEFEKTAEVRHEYYFGKLIPMPGEAKRANIIAGNIRRQVDVPFYKKGFQIFDHDIKVYAHKRPEPRSGGIVMPLLRGFDGKKPTECYQNVSPRGLG